MIGDRWRSERAWSRATSAAQLGELTARWLEGDLPAQPGYYGRVDVDPGLGPALVALNRRRPSPVLTRNSQAHDPHDDVTGGQLAWISAFMDPEDVPALRAHLHPIGARVTPLFPNGKVVHVTWAGDYSPLTTASHMSPRTVLTEVYPWCSRALVLEVCTTMIQVAITAPNNGLWNELWHWSRTRVSAWPGPS